MRNVLAILCTNHDCLQLEETSTHKSAKTHTSSVFVTRNLDRVVWKTDAARITEFGTETFHDEWLKWKPIYFGVERSKSLQIQVCMTKLYWTLQGKVTNTPKINGFPELIMDRFWVKFGDPSCIMRRKKTHRQTKVKTLPLDCRWRG